MACEWITLRDALTAFAKSEAGFQGQGHIRPLHHYVACRLVIEGGFLPEEITPKPPFRVERRPGRGLALIHDPSVAGAGEFTILGGLKTKDVDVVVQKDGIGPCVAISMKGTGNAFRNLTNRMEEAAGDCTNIHITYPSLVYAFWHVMRANVEGTLPEVGRFKGKEGPYAAADTSILADGRAAAGVERYALALKRLSGRAGIREEPSRYETVALTMVRVDEAEYGRPLDVYPPPNDPLLMDRMFERIYSEYDTRFVYQAPALAPRTTRKEWLDDSPALQTDLPLEFSPRVSAA